MSTNIRMQSCVIEKSNFRKPLIETYATTEGKKHIKCKTSLC